MNLNNETIDDEIFDDDDEIFTLDDEKFQNKFKEMKKEQEKIKIWVEPLEDKLQLYIQNGSSSKKLVAKIEFKQFKDLQKLGINSTIEKIQKIIPNIDLSIAKQLNQGLIQNASQS